MGPKVGRKRQHHSIRDNSRKHRTRARTKDLDQIFAEYNTVKLVLDQDLPGNGLCYCKECARHFINEQALQEHCKTKLHKKMLKVLKNDTPYSQKEADLAAGLG